MPRIIHCVKLNKEAPGLDEPPYPGPVGERIYNEISAEAWKDWLNQQTMLINENRLKLTSKEARAFLQTAMMQYLFEE